MYVVILYLLCQLLKAFPSGTFLILDFEIWSSIVAQLDRYSYKLTVAVLMKMDKDSIM